MKAYAVFTALVLMVYVSGVVAQQPVVESYGQKEAYEVYSVLLSHDEKYGQASGTLVIQQETLSNVRLSVSPSKGRAACFTEEAATRFADAIADFGRVNKKKWLLQRDLNIERPYELLTADTVQLLLFNARADGHDDFEKRYPDSGGYVFDMSAVGFNRDKTQAVVYFGSYCGGLCGHWSFHLMEKVDGKWKEAPGVTCFTVS